MLIADRAGCTPGILEMIKDDMIRVISKYMEIDTNGLEIKITQMKDPDAPSHLPLLYVSVPVRVLLTKGTCQ